MRERVDIDALLTPQNQYLFLYDAHGLPADLLASYQSSYQSIVSTEPVAREDLDVYFDDRTVYYLKEPCDGADTSARFFLHVFPADLEDLPADRRQNGFDNLDFYFVDRALLFGGRCMVSVDLPQYDIAGFHTGRVRADGVQVWSAAHVVQAPKLISEYQSITSNEPVARAEFDVYIHGGKLYYVKEPCASEDVRAGFFLHIVPEDENDLPDARKQHGHGFDNLDFDFDVRGVLFDGKCMASVDLPQYGIARIVTGQFDAGGRIWEVEFATDARK